MNVQKMDRDLEIVKRQADIKLANELLDGAHDATKKACKLAEETRIKAQVHIDSAARASEKERVYKLRLATAKDALKRMEE